MWFKSSQHHLQNRCKSTIFSESIKSAANIAPFDSRMAKVVDLAEPAQHAKGKRSGLAYLAIAGIATLFPIHSNAVDAPKPLWSNPSFAVDSCLELTAANGGKTLKNCNFFVRNYADASLEIYDKGGLLIESYILDGARPSTSVFEQAIKGSKYFVTTSLELLSLKDSGEYPWNDFRNQSGTMRQSKKTTLKPFVIPKGGKLVITQKSNNAIAVNALSISIAWINRFISNDSADLLTKYIKDYPQALALASQEYGSVVAKLTNDNETSPKTWGMELAVATFKIITGDIAKRSKDPTWKANNKIWVDANTSTFAGAVKNLNALIGAAELIGEFLSTAGQVGSLIDAITYNHTITYVNNLPLPTPTNRFPDLADYYYQDLYELELAGFTLSAKNWNKPFQPEIFGADDRLNKNEFLRMMGEIMKRAGYPISPSNSTYSHPYYDLYRQLSDSESVTLSNVTVYSLLDKALNLAFGDNYALCVGTDAAKAFMRVKKGEDFFKNGYHNFIKQLYMAGIVLTNTLPTDGTVTIFPVTREESLHWYINLHNAMTKGKAKGCGV